MQIRLAKPRRLEVWITDYGTSRKFWIKSLNRYVNKVKDSLFCWFWGILQTVDEWKTLFYFIQAYNTTKCQKAKEPEYNAIKSDDIKEYKGVNTHVQNLKVLFVNQWNGLQSICAFYLKEY